MHAPGPEGGPSRARVRVRESSRTRRDRRPLGKSYRSGPQPATKAYRENPRSTRNGGVRSRRGRGVPRAGRRVLVRPPSISGCPGDGSESPAELRVTGRIYGGHPTELPDQTGSGLDSGTVPTRLPPIPVVRESRRRREDRGDEGETSPVTGRYRSACRRADLTDGGLPRRPTICADSPGCCGWHPSVSGGTVRVDRGNPVAGPYHPFVGRFSTRRLVLVVQLFQVIHGNYRSRFTGFPRLDDERRNTPTPSFRVERLEQVGGGSQSGSSTETFIPDRKQPHPYHRKQISSVGFLVLIEQTLATAREARVVRRTGLVRPGCGPTVDRGSTRNEGVGVPIPRPHRPVPCRGDRHAGTVTCSSRAPG
jgi:hypothetical protein